MKNEWNSILNFIIELLSVIAIVLRIDLYSVLNVIISFMA